MDGDQAGQPGQAKPEGAEELTIRIPKPHIKLPAGQRLVWGAIFVAIAVVLSVAISSMAMGGLKKEIEEKMLAKEEFSGIAGNIESSVGGIRQDINLLVFDLNKTNVDLNAHKRTRSISAHSLSCKTVNAAGTKFASDYNATADKNGFTAIKCTSICSIGAKLKCLVGERKVGGTEYIVPCEEEQKFKKADLSTASMRCICCS